MDKYPSIIILGQRILDFLGQFFGRANDLVTSLCVHIKRVFGSAQSNA
jgi:hypothetical protein